ncbi:unnamed protein product [Euphydryas editha]|uniref:Reverse transcriptase domain-containing protein n=1 Tax=Euphydryas editha TaxID=104508 RepID=A0AAU9UQ45_EUPED|nr:unnamed protein product [Euphydryas editha]
MPHHSPVFIVGDFNLSNILWTPDSNDSDLLPKQFCNNVDNLVLANSSKWIKVSKADDALLPIDHHHPPLNININLRTHCDNYIRSSRAPFLNFFLCDFDGISSELDDIDWLSAFNNSSSVDEKVDILYQKIMPIIYKYTPMRKPRDSHYPIWFSVPLLRALREKAKYHCKSKKFNNSMDKYSYEILRERCAVMIKDCYKKFKKRVSECIYNDPSYFWTFFKQQRKNSANFIPNEMFLKDFVAKGGKSICNAFVKHFESIYTCPRDCQSEDYPTPPPVHEISNIPFSVCRLSEEEVFNHLSNLDPCKGAGPDLLAPLFLKKCARQLARPLTLIYNHSLYSGVFPTRWKVAYVTPVYKSGNSKDITNYRPISILSVIGKVLESIVQKRIYFHIAPYLDFNQHGFRPCKSTTSNLVSYISDIAEIVDSAGEVHAIYTDFRKAFDLVNHKLLMLKTEYMGIHGSLLRWCESYLENRSQLVAVNGFMSYEIQVPSGVPQGSHLGPTFFLIFINDLTLCLHSKMKLFADDLKIYRVINCQHDTRALQNDIDAVNSWCIRNGMSLNIDKCYHIKFTRKRNRFNCVYKINNINLTEVDCIRDLGVIIDSTLSFRNHIEYVTTKASKLSGLVYRQMKMFNNPNLSILVFNCIVRSLLEYCSVVWSPGYRVHSDRIERIQKRFLFHLAYGDFKCKELFTYEARLSYYNILMLKDRRRIADIIFLAKLLKGSIDAPELVERLKFLVPREGSRLHNRKTFSLPKIKSNLGRHSPIYRMQHFANGKRDVIDIFCDSIPTIKNKLYNELRV